MIGEFLQADLEEIIARKAWDELRDALSELDPPDVAEILTDLPAADTGVIFRVLTRERAAAAFSYLPVDEQEELIRSLSLEQTTGLVAEMTPDDRARLLDELPADVTRRLLAALSPEELKATRDLLGYPPGTAGRYMTPEYVAVRPDMTAAEALRHVKRTGRGKETLAIVYVVDAGGRLVEDVRLGALVMADDSVSVADIEDRPLVSIPAAASGDDVVAAFERYDRVALPVVDADGKMLGIITADDVLEFSQRKATAEMQKLGGSEALDRPYFEVGFFEMLKKRGGWLAALFLGETLTATAMGRYESEIAKAAVVALFVPLIISSGGNSGSQATSILIRSLALQEVKLADWWRVFRKELSTSLVLGTFLGAVGFCRVSLWYALGWKDYDGHPFLIAATVWASLVGVVTFGSLVGSMLPFLLRKVGLDPATASAPFVATLVDVTGLVIYFTVASMILKGTLL
ncbi:MAG: magnesium transporter [Phycisphaerales bacterium]|nr:magnesium transporter [Phycisphaerales bacterium]